MSGTNLHGNPSVFSDVTVERSGNHRSHIGMVSLPCEIAYELKMGKFLVNTSIDAIYCDYYSQ